MSAKTSIATLLLLSAVLLTGCTVSFGTGTKATQVTGDKIETACEQQDIPSQSTPAQQQEELRLANERARLAEEKAEFEKQKREFAEERLKKPDTMDRNENGEEPSEDKVTGES